MQLKAQHIFPALQPYRIVVDLGLKIQEQNGLSFTPHPKDSAHLLQISTNEFIGQANGPTPACNLFDFLALYFGSYGTAADFAINRYYNLASLPVGLGWEAVRDPMVAGLKADREQFENILSLRDFLPRGAVPVSALQYCSGKALSQDKIWRMLYIVAGKDLNLVLQRLPNAGGPLDDKQCYLVFPYLKNRHTFALLEICDVREKPVRTLQLHPARHVFFGLHTCFPRNQDTRAVTTRQEAMLRYSRALLDDEFRTGFVHTRFNPK